MIKTFKIDARTIINLGRDSIKDHTTALLELVKNCYDADADTVEIEIYCNSQDNYIRIADNGCGMTEKEIDENWLRIGYSEKRRNRISNLRRRKTGEKGIGRISSDRLGSILELKTKSKSSKCNGLQINWNDFDVDGEDLSEIQIKVLDNPILTIPKKGNTSGTELKIKDLRQKWTIFDISNLYDELSILTPPFEEVVDFEIFLKHDICNEYQGKIISPFYQTAEIELKAQFYDKKINYEIKDKIVNKEYDTIKEKIDWKNLIQKTTYTEDNNILEYPKFGPVNLSILFYPREAKLLDGTEFKLSDLRNFLDKNSGIKIYRDKIRVKPYGNPNDPEGDWLGLAERKTREPAGIRRPTWRVAANQIVGAVFISRDTNPSFHDGTGREGLIHDDNFYNLKFLVLGILNLLETHRYNKVKELDKIKVFKKESPSDTVKNLSNELTNLEKDLSEIKEQIKLRDQKPFLKTIDQVDTVKEKIKKTKKTIEELTNQNQVFRGLATIGIASAVFGHETQSSIDEFIAAIITAKDILFKKPPNVLDALDEIRKSLKYANHVSDWGAFALYRVQRDKRTKKKIKINEIYQEIIDNLKPAFDAVNIDYTDINLSECESKTFAIDIEAILLNLLTNSYTACLQRLKDRKVKIVLYYEIRNKINGFKLSVSDSGYGVAKKFKDRIWEPLFSTKVDKDNNKIGTGLGLTIVKSIVTDLKGEISVDSDLELKGARFTIWLPLK